MIGLAPILGGAIRLDECSSGAVEAGRLQPVEAIRTPVGREISFGADGGPNENPLQTQKPQSRRTVRRSVADRMLGPSKHRF